MIELQTLQTPKDCVILHHEFYNYEPAESFEESLSIQYLSENLFQCYFPNEHLKIDLGWYGDIIQNKGEFRIQIIVNENWEHPFQVIYSKSAAETKGLILNILKYYSSQEFEIV